MRAQVSSRTIAIASAGHTSAQSSQPLQYVESKPAKRRAVEHDRRVRAVEPAEQAVDALRRGRPPAGRRCASRRSRARAASSGSTTPPRGQLAARRFSSAMRIPPRRAARERLRRRPCAPSASTAASCSGSSGGSPSARRDRAEHRRCSRSRAVRARERAPGRSARVAGELAGAVVGVDEHAVRRARGPRRRRPRATSDGSSTTTRSGSVDGVVAADRPVGEARVGAERRAAALGPVLGEGLDALARAQQREREHCAAVFAPWPGAGVPADLGQLGAQRLRRSRARRRLPSRDRLDDARAAVDGVAAGEELRVRRCGPSLRRPASAAAVELETVDHAATSARGSLPDRAATTVSAGEHELAARDGLGPATPVASGSPRRIRAALDALDTQPSRGTATGAVEPLEPDAFRLAALDLVRRRRASRRGAPVGERDVVGAEAERLARDVDRGVPAAEHDRRGVRLRSDGRA